MNKHVTETIEQFLNRGGKITVVPSGAAAAAAEYNKGIISKKPSSGAASLMSMEDADLFYGETKARPKTKAAAKQPTLDVNALPAELKKKFVDAIIEEKEDEEEEN